MRTPLKTVTRNQQNKFVSLLQQALAALGFSVSQEEVFKSIAGKDTIKKVRELQAKLKVPVNNNFVVDEATASAISKELVDRGLTDTSHSFKVSGQVRLANGAVKIRQQLIAFDLDLRGVARFRTVKDLKEIIKTGSFEFLGEAVSDNQGNYNITFYDWQYQRAERGLADVVVYALDKENIVAHSRLVNTGDYINGFVRGIDLILTDTDKEIEYTSLMQSLNAFLKESNSKLEEIASSRDQLTFTANELEVAFSHINIAAQAVLIKVKNQKLNHELLYGIGRQNISLDWTALFKKQEDEIRNAITQSVKERTIQDFKEKDITEFIQSIQDTAARFMLDDKNAERINTLNVMLSHSLPKEKQRLAFLKSFNSFQGSDFSEFWDTHLPLQAEFKGKPELISALLLTQQLTSLTGNHQSLVKALQVDRGIKTAHELLDLDKAQWIKVLKKTGVPDDIEGKDEAEKLNRYADQMMNLLNAAFPTQRIARMVERKELSIEKEQVSKDIRTFLNRHKDFNFASSTIENFSEKIEAVAQADRGEVKKELKKLQRVFQVSTSPDAMAILLKNRLHSAHAIATIPRKNFVNTYSKDLGSTAIAHDIHQRATHNNTRAELNAMNIMQFAGNTATPAKAMSAGDFNKAVSALKEKVPNYETLFGSPDICECQHCRSVFSPAAYYVDLLQFLEKSLKSSGLTPYEVLVGKTNIDGTIQEIGRRPDLDHLALTCENTNTLIPYIDLANEVMEFYVASGDENMSLSEFQGHNTGDVTQAELRANPHHSSVDAYQKLSTAKFPFSLPFHQPLDVIRTYSDHLKVSRYDVMKAMHPHAVDATQKAIEAEALRLSPEEYQLLTGEAFNGTADTTPIHAFFGFETGTQAEITSSMESLSPVKEFMKRTGLSYTDLIELLKTQFINPHQGTLDFLEKIFSSAFIDGNIIYEWLKNAVAGTPNSNVNNGKIEAAIESYNAAEGTNITTEEISNWAIAHFNDFQQVITLFEPSSRCNLETTRLRTIQAIYEKPDTEVIDPTNGVTTQELGASGLNEDNNQSWSRFHRFIRLWRTLGWTIHETDLILAALGQDNIGTETISKLETVLLLKTATKLPLNKLAVLWGDIDTHVNNSLFKKLFLNKSALEIDQAFAADAQGNYLQDVAQETLALHKMTILAAFRITEEELHFILTQIPKDKEAPLDLQVPIDIEAPLNLQNLSAIYRHVVLADALKFSVIDLCKLIDLFDATPFSSPKDTYEFYQTAAAIKTTKFKPDVLDYIFKGNVSTDTKIGLDSNKVFQTAKAIRAAFTVIDQAHPTTLSEALSVEILSAKLSLTFQADIVKRLLEIVENVAEFSIQTAENLVVTIPEKLAKKYTYSAGRGLLVGVGVMTDEDRNELIEVNNNAFEAAVNDLYTAPETFLSDHFKGVFEDLSEANKILLNHPAENTSAILENKLKFIYDQFIPLLIGQLKSEVLIQHLADLIGISAEATALLIKAKAGDMDALITAFSSQKFSADYFNGKNFEAPAIPREDSSIRLDGIEDVPDSLITTDGFSVRWEAYLAPPSSGDYTFIVDVEDSDDAFSLFLDGQLMLSKPANDQALSFEKVVSLDTGKNHHLRLEYVKSNGKAGIGLRWKTATTALEFIPSTAAYPGNMLEDFVKRATIFHRAAIFISGFKMTETELGHYIKFSQNFGNIDFRELKLIDWKRVHDYIALRNSVPQAQALLTDFFSLVNLPSPTSGEQLKEKLNQATGWDKPNLDFLLARFGLNEANFKDEFKDEKVLNQLSAIMQNVAKTGLSAETIDRWAEAETNFANLNSTAQLLKKAVKSKYQEEDWLNVSAKLSDKVREHQQQALINYLLVQPSIRDAGIEDADGLFEYFLIDVQMGACMDTSRIVQASAAIQLFVNRCLLNLEKEVSPNDIDANRWEWMKNYRVWEANRKIFLYTENWLEPEWRSDKSEFFKELESHLVQNDITSRSVEKGLRNYVMSLNEVANLDVCGLHQENGEQGEKFLHVFGRTHNLPYKYFYRRWNQHHKWSAWEKVQLDIRSVEDEDGENSGVHLIPVVWKGRLFLFWPEFMEKTRQSDEIEGKKVKDLAEQSVALLKPKKYWEIRLAWSEYVDDTWSPKKVSKEYISTKEDLHVSTASEEEILFYPVRDTVKDELRIFLITDAWDLMSGPMFVLSDIQSKVEVYTTWEHNRVLEEINRRYLYSFLKRKRFSTLNFSDLDYLQNDICHKLLPIDTQFKLSITLENPFFFNDHQRTYFVCPTGSSKLVNVQKPEVSENAVNVLFNVKPTANSIGISDRVSVSNRNVSNSMAFGSSVSGHINVVSTEALEFHTFYHPFSSEFVTRLNQKGIPHLMERNVEPSPDDINPKSVFQKTYQPNYTYGLVKKHSSFSTPPSPRTAYKENICFDVFGANSLYNWELFFHAPLYIATRLSKNGKYKEATQWFHYIFDPTTDEEAYPANETARYWKVLPFKTQPEESLRDWFEDLAKANNDDSPETKLIEEWKANPFNSHLVASNRPVAYMKHVVIKYVENLIHWGDSLFRQFTRENVYEAMQLYVIANHILGPRPEFIPKRGAIKAETYNSLKGKLDGFTNALVELENIFPYSSSVTTKETDQGSNFLGIGQALYFCIPANEKLIHYWDTVADRLFKIRHCQDIDGVERTLALFAPVIDPGLLMQANAQGLSLGDIMANLSSPTPIHRFALLLQKANEFCSDVKALGSALLAALEKKDAEELSRLRAAQETNMVELMTAVRERQVLAAKVNKKNLMKVRETAVFRLNHYNKELLGNETITIPDTPSLEATLNANGPLPQDTIIQQIETDVDDSLVESDERGVKLIRREESEIYFTQKSREDSIANMNQEIFAGFMGLISQFGAQSQPLGVGGAISFGGQQLGWLANSKAKMFATSSQLNSIASNTSAKMASYIRREQDWTLQANLAAKEIIQIDKQLTSADIQIQIAEKELQNHQQQIENTKEVELFLKDKFTNFELYQWMKEQLFTVYKQSYNLAFEMAKKAEKAYQYELGVELTNFIQYGYWDNTMEGLLAGEKLQLGLREMDKAFLEDNRRELELSKSISMVMTSPYALLQLKETGKCFLSFPEELFDLDFPGHYFRRIKAVSLSIPCIAGPHTTVNCSLRLVKNSMRINTSLNPEYQHNNEEGFLIDDDRFRSNNVPVTSIATSSGQNDAGMFEFNFRDERYLPFERAGAISDWQIELSTEKDLRHFDYSTISDVILHLKYTAREGSKELKDSASEYIKDFFFGKYSATPALKIINFKHDFPSEWHRFLHSDNPGDGDVLRFKLTANLFPFRDRNHVLKIETVTLVSNCNHENDYTAKFTSPSIELDDMVVKKESEFGGLHHTKKEVSIEINFSEDNIWDLEIPSPADVNFKKDEIKDLILILGYSWGDEI